MATDAKVLSLHAAGGLGQIIVTALATAPVGMACLPYMQPASIRIYEATTNNFASATLVGTISSATGVFVRDGLGASVTRYYWAAALDSDGNEGARYPVGGGAAATTLTATPGPNSIGTDQLQGNAVTAAKMNVSQLSAITANLGNITAGLVTGVVLRTAPSGDRVVIDGPANALSVIEGATEIVRIGPAVSSAWEGNISVRNSGAPAIYANKSGATVAPAARFVVSGIGRGLEVHNSSNNANGVGAFFNNGLGGRGDISLPNVGGGYAFYATRGGYGPFTGSHDALISKVEPAEPGDIVFDRRVLQRSGWDDVLTEVSTTSIVGQKGVIGIVATRFPFDPMSDFASFRAPEDRRSFRQMLNGTGEPPKPGIVRRRWADRYDRLKINSVGEGQMNVCGRGGDLECGDLICASDLAGKGQLQADDIVRSWTVAKTREAVTFDYPDQVKIVAVIYLCG